MNSGLYRLFVYGSLMTGEGNHRRLRGARLLGAVDSAPGYALYDLGPFPGLVREGLGRVSGELYLIDGETRDALDRLEGHPTFYCRMLMQLDDVGSAEAYMLSKDQVRGLPVIASGSWRDRKGSFR